MSTTVVRIDSEAVSQAGMIAAVRRETPGAMLAEAWKEYWERHRDELAEEFDEVAAMMRAGDTAGLAAYASRSVEERAEAAAARITRN